MRHGLTATALACLLATASGAARAAETPHNVVLFVPDGLRRLMVDDKTAPAMAAIRDKGVNFVNSHALFPTFTTANASGMATGHMLGDTGDFSNTVYAGHVVVAAGDTVTPFLESDPVLGEMDALFKGDYLDEATILEAARQAGYGTASIGKVGPVLIFDPTERSGVKTMIVDDQTGATGKTGAALGIPLSPALRDALTAAGLPLATPGRGANAPAGDMRTPGTTTANIVQQNYFAAVATKAVLPLLKARDKPFVMVFWSRDPDGSQHNQGDSLNTLIPGINGPTSLAGIKNADDDLAMIQKALADLGLAASTDIIVSADHGFATISKESHTSAAAHIDYADVPSGYLPPGFLAIDLAAALNLPLYDANDDNAPVPAQGHPKAGNGVIGRDPAHPQVVVAANGGSDLVYLPTRDKKLAARVVEALLKEDYVSGLFVDPALGSFPGTLPQSAIAFRGKARTPQPAIVVNFRSFTTGCAVPTNCTAEIADTPLQQGQGMHGSFSRAETMNLMAAIGPDFKAGFVDPAPVSNADLGKTVARLLGLKIAENGHLVGRVIAEAMPGGTVPHFVARHVESGPSAGGIRTVMDYQQTGATRYFDAAGFPGRTAGLGAAAGEASAH